MAEDLPGLRHCTPGLLPRGGCLKLSQERLYWGVGVHIHIYTHECLYMYVSLFTFFYTGTQACTYMYIYIQVCMCSIHACVYIYIYAYVVASAFSCIQMIIQHTYTGSIICIQRWFSVSHFITTETLVPGVVRLRLAEVRQGLESQIADVPAAILYGNPGLLSRNLN